MEQTASPAVVAKEMPQLLKKMGISTHFGTIREAGGLDEWGRPLPDVVMHELTITRVSDNKVIKTKRVLGGTSVNEINANFYAMVKELATSKGVTIDKSDEELLREHVKNLQQRIDALETRGADKQDDRTPPETEVMATNHAKKLLAEHPDVNPALIVGTGEPHGIITKDDVQKYLDLLDSDGLGKPDDSEDGN